MRVKLLVSAVLLFQLLLIAGIFLWYQLSFISRVLEEGDRFIFRSDTGRYEVWVEKKATDQRMIYLQGKEKEGWGFYELELALSYQGRFLEIKQVRARGLEFTDCVISREEKGFFLFPIKRVRGAKRDFTFRASCVEEGSIVFMDKMERGKKERISTPAGEFEVIPISHTVTYPFQEEVLGSGKFAFSPELGFPVKIHLVVEGKPYSFILEKAVLLRKKK